MAGNMREAGRTTASRILALLTAFNVARPVMTLAELARASELPLTTTHRLVGDMVKGGAVVKLPDGRYTVGLTLWEVGCLAPEQRDLRTVALPFMQDLYEVTHENVLLAVREGTQVLYLEKISGARSVNTVTEVGARFPLHATGVGKVFLAFSGPELLREVVDGRLRRYTPSTITMPGMLAQALCRVRESGVAFSRDEMTIGASSVAAPIYTRQGTVQAALAITARSTTNLEPLVPAVRTAACGVTRRMTLSLMTAARQWGTTPCRRPGSMTAAGESSDRALEASTGTA